MDKRHFDTLTRALGRLERRRVVALLPATMAAVLAGAETVDARRSRKQRQQEREKLILFEDYRVVDGILFPHKITTQINGKLIEELSFTKFKVNQPIKAEKFTEKQ